MIALVLSLFLALAGIMLAWAVLWLFLTACACIAIAFQFACDTAWTFLLARLRRKRH